MAISPDPRARALTEGERLLAASIFGDALDCEKVRIVRRKWWPLQPREVAMAPTGNIHIPPKSSFWSDDFAQASLAHQGLFVHELTHVWQTQARGRFYLVLMRHPFCRYAYALKPGRRFGDYGLEQQGEIVRHAFLLREGGAVPDAPPLETYVALLPFDFADRR